MVNDLLATLARAEIAASLAVLAVLGLRGPVRRAFGARAAYGLWLAAALAASASLLPARIEASAAAPVAAMPAGPTALIGAVAQMTDVAVAPVRDPSGPILALWLAGVALSLALLAMRQRRFVRGLGRLSHEGPRLVRAEAAGFGPAVVGALDPRIVVPNDFEAHFTADEQEIVLAHERAHLAARDPLVNAAAAVFQAVSWFNPLAYAAAYYLRLDQELACDAAVVSLYPKARRRYGETMLKTQLAPLALPLGCDWPARGAEPLKLRIAMLKATPPGPVRRGAGAGLAVALTLGGGLAAWAAQPPAAQGGDRVAYAQAASSDPVNGWRVGDGTPLIIAARDGDAAAVSALLAKGADPNLAAQGDGNPLIAASASGADDVARLLIAHGAKVNANVIGDETPLITAARYGRLNMVRLLVESGADVNLAVRKDGVPGAELRSPLRMARRHRDGAIAQYLMGHGATD